MLERTLGEVDWLMNLVRALRLISPIAVIFAFAPRLKMPADLADKPARACVSPSRPVMARLPSASTRSPNPPLMAPTRLASAGAAALEGFTNSIALSAKRVTGLVRAIVPLLANRRVPPASVMLPVPNWASDPICSTPASMRVRPL